MTTCGSGSRQAPAADARPANLSGRGAELPERDEIVHVVPDFWQLPLVPTRQGAGAAAE
jgi:hypothetical protein